MARAASREIPRTSRPVGAPAGVRARYDFSSARRRWASAAHLRGESAEAIRLQEAHEQQSPAGAFAADASLVLIENLRKEGRLDEARKQAARFGSRFPGHPRANEVGRLPEQPAGSLPRHVGWAGQTAPSPLASPKRLTRTV